MAGEETARFQEAILLEVRLIKALSMRKTIFRQKNLQ
jgi:hypothetical protein